MLEQIFNIGTQLLTALTTYNLAGIIIFIFFILIIYLLHINNKNTKEMLTIMKDTVKCETAIDIEVKDIKIKQLEHSNQLNKIYNKILSTQR